MALSVGWRQVFGMVATPEREAWAEKQVETVIVTLKTGSTIKGVLARQASDAIILRAAAQADMDPTGRVTWKPMGGDVVVPMDNVDYWQQGLDPAIAAE